MDSFHWWTFSEKKKDRYFPKTQPCYSRNVWHIILKFIVKHWRFGDKLTRILISSALSHVAPKSIGTIKFNIGRHSLGRGETYIQEWHHAKFRYYPNDIKSWILWTFYEVTTARHDTRKAYNLQLFVVPKLEYYFWQDRQINASQVDVAIIYWVWARG